MPAVAESYQACSPADELKGVAQVWGYKQNPSDRWWGLFYVGVACLVGAGAGYAYEKNLQSAKQGNKR